MNNNSLDNLIKIFNITKKKELDKHCKKITIVAEDFSDLVFACQGVGCTGYLHIPYFDEVIDECHKPTKKDLKLLSEGKPSIFIDKIGKLFKTRKYRIGHMFYRPTDNKWHFFRFSLKEIDEKNPGWCGGPHIHLINYLFSGQNCINIFEDFVNNRKLPKGFHIRWENRNFNKKLITRK